MLLRAVVDQVLAVLSEPDASRRVRELVGTAELAARLAAVERALSEHRAEQTSPAPEPSYLSPAQAAKRWGVSERHVRELVRAGLPSLRVGRRVRIDLVAGERWLTARKSRAHLRVVGGSP